MSSWNVEVRDYFDLAVSRRKYELDLTLEMHSKRHG